MSVGPQYVGNDTLTDMSADKNNAKITTDIVVVLYSSMQQRVTISVARWRH